MQITTIHEERTFEVARKSSLLPLFCPSPYLNTHPGIEDLKPLTKTAPCKTNVVAEYDHVFMGHSRKAFPVCLYDSILAELTYKLEHLDATGDEATKLFPHASDFREASETFCRDGAKLCRTEKERGEIAFRLFKTIFGDKCVEQVPIPMPPSKGEAPRTTTTKSMKTTGSEPSDSSKGSRRSYAKPDGTVTSKAGSSALPEGDDEEADHDDNEEAEGGDEKKEVAAGDVEKKEIVAGGVEKKEVAAGGVEKKAGQLLILPILIEIKRRFGDAVMQSVKVFARYLCYLEVRSL